MEIFSQATGAQLLFSAGAVGVVLLLAVIVFTLGFKPADEPQFDKLPLVLEDRKSSIKKRKTKEKKSPANGQAVQDSGSKNLESGKKSPSKAKEPAAEKQVKKEKKVKTVEVISEGKQKKKGKQSVVYEKPSDYDEGEWETVPTKSEKKKSKPQDENKKDSPLKEKKKSSEPQKSEESAAKESVEDDVPVMSADEVNLALQEQVKLLQRILNEAEKRDSAPIVIGEPAPEIPEEIEIAEPVVAPAENKDKDKKKKKEKKPKAEESIAAQVKEASIDLAPAENGEALGDSGVAFDELGDVWTEAKAPKKSKKKVRKE